MRTRDTKGFPFLAALVAISCGGAPVAPGQPKAGVVVPCPTSSVAQGPVAVTCPEGAEWNGKACAGRLAPEPTDFDALAASELAANSKPGVRHLPARDVPVPTEDVSPQEQAFIGSPFRSGFMQHPKDAAEWKALIANCLLYTSPSPRD